MCSSLSLFRRFDGNPCALIMSISRLISAYSFNSSTCSAGLLSVPKFDIVVYLSCLLSSFSAWLASYVLAGAAAIMSLCKLSSRSSSLFSGSLSTYNFSKLFSLHMFPYYVGLVFHIFLRSCCTIYCDLLLGMFTHESIFGYFSGGNDC